MFCRNYILDALKKKLIVYVCIFETFWKYVCAAFIDHFFPDARFVVVSGGTDATIPRRWDSFFLSHLTWKSIIHEILWQCWWQSVQTAPRFQRWRRKPIDLTYQFSFLHSLTDGRVGLDTTLSSTTRALSTGSPRITIWVTLPYPLCQQVFTSAMVLA